MKKTVFILFAFAALLTAIPAAAPPPAPPDLTKGERDPQEKRTYNLGATGMRGWIHTKAASNLDAAQGRTTTASRQILVTHVGAKSPADGVMQVDDVILGVAGKPFDGDARQSIAKAIQEAEKTEHNGILQLTRWRTTKNIPEAMNQWISVQRVLVGRMSCLSGTHGPAILK